MKNIVSIKPIDSLLADYQTHLLNVAGIAPSTCERRAFYARSFLTAHFKPKARSLDFRQITAVRLRNFVLEQTQTLAMSSMATATSCLRCFCQFLYMRGLLPNDVSQGVPRIGSHGRDSLLAWRDAHRRNSQSKNLVHALRQVAGGFEI
jgi:site-specific recombinase XerC